MRLLPFSRSTDTGGDRMQALSLDSFLTRLIWLCVLPLVILAVFLATNHVSIITNQREREAADRTRNVAAVIDQHLRAQIAGLQMLAASPLVDDPPRLAEFYQEAQNFRENFGGHVVLADLSTQMIFNTRVPFGEALPKLPVPKGHAAAPTVLATGKPAVGDMFFGPVAKEPLVTAVVPVNRGGEMKFLLVSAMGTRQFQQSLDEVALPAGWSLTLLDGKDEVMARRSSPEMEGPPIDPEPPGRFTAKPTASHWTVVLEVPRNVYRKPVLTAALAFAGGILAVTLISVLAGRLAGRRLARSVEALAKRPSSQLTRPVIAEIEAVRNLLCDTAAARQAAESTIRESEERLRLALHAAKAGTWEWNLSTNENFWSDELWRLYGMEPHVCEPSYEAWRQTIHPDDRERTEQTVQEASRNGTELHAEWRVRDQDGGEHWLMSRGRPLCDAQGQPVRYIGVVIDITERKRAEEELRDSLEEKVALLKEVHHRVKNNLQIVASLINLQASRLRDRQEMEVLQDIRNRVHSMALLHELLYRSGNLARINFGAYVAELCKQLIRSFGPAVTRVKVESLITRVGLPLEQSVPCGLIVNELVSNALKHGFPDQRTGRITVTLKPTEGRRFLLCVCDDGVGLPGDLDISTVSTLGLQLVSGLAGQLGGQLEVHPSDGRGAAFCVAFPISGDTVFEGES